MASDVLGRFRVAYPDASGIPDDVAETPYVWMGDLAGLLLDAYQTGGDAFDAVFGELESMLSSSASQLRNLLIVGFIESLQNLTLNSGLPLSIWEPWLNGATLDAWRAVEQVWNGKMAPEDFNLFVEGSPGVQSTP